MTCEKFKDPYELSIDGSNHIFTIDKVKASDSKTPQNKKSYENILNSLNDITDIYHDILFQLNTDKLANLFLNSLRTEANRLGIEVCPQVISDIDLIYSEITSLIDCYSPDKINTDLSIDIPYIPSIFDLYQGFRNAILNSVESLISQIIKNLLETLVVMLDGTFINNFLYPSNLNTSQRDALTNTKPGNTIFKNDVKQCISTIIKRNNLTLTETEYYIIISKITSNFNLLELNSIFHGVFNGTIFDSIKSIITSVVGDKISTDLEFEKIILALEDCINPNMFEANQVDTTICGNYNVPESSLSIDEVKAAVLQDKIKKVCNVLSDKNRTTTLNELNLPNSDPTKIMLNQMIDILFDSFGKNYRNFSLSILENILVNPKGEMCIAGYTLFDDKNTDNIEEVLGEDLTQFITKQINPEQQERDIFSSFFNLRTFYEKYDINNQLNWKFSTSRAYVGNGYFQFTRDLENIYFDKDNVIINLSDVNFVFKQTFSSETLLWIQQKNKQKDLFQEEINSIIFNELGINLNIAVNQFNLLDNLFGLNTDLLSEEILKKFYFQDKFEPNVFKENLLKYRFSNTDFANIELSKLKIKQELDIL